MATVNLNPSGLTYDNLPLNNYPLKSFLHQLSSESSDDFFLRESITFLLYDNMKEIFENDLSENTVVEIALMIMFKARFGVTYDIYTENILKKALDFLGVKSRNM